MWYLTLFSIYGRLFTMFSELKFISIVLHYMFHAELCLCFAEHRYRTGFLVDFLRLKKDQRQLL